jgi:hypothetical protein
MALAGEAVPQRIHQVDNPTLSEFFRPLDSFAPLFSLNQFLERFLVMVLELLWSKMAGLGLDNIDCEVQHILGNFLIRNIIEIISFSPDLIRVAERQTHHALATRFQRDHVFPRRENDTTERNHTLFSDCFTYDSEGLTADGTLGGDEIGKIQIKFVDLVPRHELLNLDGVRAFHCYGLHLVVRNLDEAALRDFIASDDGVIADRLTSFRIELAVLDPVSCFSVDEIKSNLFLF